MTDHPRVIHAVARRRALRMVEPGRNPDRVVLPDLDHFLAELGVAVALRLGEAIVIDLRLRVMVRRIARPAAGKRHDFAQHQLDFGPASCVGRRSCARSAARVRHLARDRAARSPPAAGREDARRELPAYWRSRRRSARQSVRASILTAVPAATCTQLADSSNSELALELAERQLADRGLRIRPLISSHAVSQRRRRRPGVRRRPAAALRDRSPMDCQRRVRAA